jgi:murein DD-endopeptidase MepM/ murein hydrolase activator NlpD
MVACLVPISIYAQDTGPIYIVQEGDNLYLIALRFGTTVDAIASANGITDPSVIVPGVELVIPGFEGVSGVLDFHELEFGESISSIHTRFDLPPDGIIRLNRILHPGRLYIGQALIITSSAEVETAPKLSLYLAEEGEGKLGFAARHRVNPWDLRGFADHLDRTWVVRNERIIIHGEEEFLHALPKPIRNIEVEPERVKQGNTLKVKINTDKIIPLTGWLGQWQLNFQELSEDQLMSLQGVFALAEPGLYNLEMQIWDSEMERVRFSHNQLIRIVDGGYYYDPVLYVPDETVDSEKIKVEDEFINSVINHVTSEKYWDGIFEFPTSYTDSFPSYFGSRRNYNNLGYNWYHNGLDLYGGKGTPVSAPASGRIVYSGLLDVRGNVIYIDHGWGVFSGFLHLSEIDVGIGDWVETGQEIGMVGDTGRVTGPHLHWEIWVNGFPVDPLEWTSQLFP